MSRLLLRAILIVVAVITSLEGFPTENPMANKDQLEMHEAHEDDDNEQKLVSVNGTSPSGDGIQASDLESVETCTGILSHAQLQDIQLQQSNQLYFIINGQILARENPLDLYIQVFRIVSQMVGTNSVTDVWLSRAPCSTCIDYLELIFSPFRVKPVLHVESLNYRGSNYDLLRDIGCLAKLKTRNFQLKTWDWDVFRAKYEGSCDYTSTTLHNTEYMTQKSTTKALVDHVEENLIRTSLVKLCDL